MTDDQRVNLLKLHAELWEKIKPMEDQIRPLRKQLDCVTEIIVSEFKTEPLLVPPLNCNPDT